MHYSSEMCFMKYEGISYSRKNNDPQLRESVPIGRRRIKLQGRGKKLVVEYMNRISFTKCCSEIHKYVVQED